MTSQAHGVGMWLPSSGVELLGWKQENLAQIQVTNK